KGRNLVIEYRWAGGDYARFPALVGELLAAKVDVIVTAGTPAALAVKRTTTSTPCVMVAVGDPVGSKLISSLAQPGGNLTGLSSIAPDLEGKRLELLRDVLPNLSYVAVLQNSSNPFHATSVRQAREAARALRIKLQILDVQKAEQLGAAFASIVKERPEAVLVLADRVFLHDRVRIADFVAQHRLPSVNAYRELVEAGSLMSFGPSYADMHRRAAQYVHKILRGAKAGELPVEQPVKFELFVNAKAAKIIGLTIPPTIIARADEVIE
ncbi:MAG TPA: ABC transporter substrate-binding protein, partial [Pirellulales bacterium]|nr:ABC transporter substrate-binding protein [Pirellulales bacterium]